MRRAHRVLAAIVPEPRRDWIVAHAAELADIRNRRQRLRWMIGLIPLALRAAAGQLRHDPHTFLGGVLVRAVVVAASTVNLLAGIGLVTLVVSGHDVPLPVLAPALALVAQGGYTLALILGARGSAGERPRQLQVWGSTLALLVGALWLIVGIVNNINPVDGDPEYGPMTIAVLLSGHGLASLLAFAAPHGEPISTA